MIIFNYFCAKEFDFEQRDKMDIIINGKLTTYAMPVVMGIVNFTDDSFYSGSRCGSEEAVLKMAERHIAEGCDWLDVGAVSTRPGAGDLPAEVEKNRIVEAVSALRQRFPEIPISVDTWRADVAAAAVEAGADIINDISGGTFDAKMFDTIAELKVPYILMHTSAKPSEMQDKTQYDNILSDILKFFGDRIRCLREKGVSDIIIDPGFGFGKTVAQNYHILRDMLFFKELGCHVLAGVSRKSMIYKPLNTTPEESLVGTAVVNYAALQNGADILRVHDVKAAKEVITLFSLLNVPHEGADSL